MEHQILLHRCIWSKDDLEGGWSARSSTSDATCVRTTLSDLRPEMSLTHGGRRWASSPRKDWLSTTEDLLSPLPEQTDDDTSPFQLFEDMAWRRLVRLSRGHMLSRLLKDPYQPTPLPSTLFPRSLRRSRLWYCCSLPLSESDQLLQYTPKNPCTT